MPTYLYVCPDHGEFEEYHSISYIIEECTKCKEEGKNPQKVKRLICGTAKGIVELTGQELTDKIKEDVKKLKQDAAKSEKIYANLLGESKYHDLQTKIDRAKRER
jgi:hypothetical protein